MRTDEALVEETGDSLVFAEASTTVPSETALLSELALAQDWERPEEVEAWSHLQTAGVDKQEGKQCRLPQQK